MSDIKGIGVDILLQEHDNILKYIEVVRKKSIEIMNGGEVDCEFLRNCINFSRFYADKHHHGKEELILFRVMVEEMGPLAEKLINQGMLVEHDMGRGFIMNLEAAIDAFAKDPSDENRIQIIANAVGYCNLLFNHIDKENNAVYTFAQRGLNEELMAKVDAETAEFEEEFKENREFYVDWISKVHAEVFK